MDTIYNQLGFKDRADYLESLSKQFKLSFKFVVDLAIIYGIDEDFDGLISALNIFMDTDIEDFQDSNESSLLSVKIMSENFSFCAN
jgi:hypothetical protein